MGDGKKRGFLGRLLRSLFVIITSYLALVGLMVTILGILIGVYIFSAIRDQDSMKSVKTSPTANTEIEQSILHLKLDRPIVAESMDDSERFFSSLFSDTIPVSLMDLQTALRRAAEDARVHAVLLDISNTEGSFSTMTALRRSLDAYRASQKPLYVSLNDGNTALYFLATAGNKINLSPLGGLTITGPAFQLAYFQSALDKLGLHFEVIRAGKFKSAMESFVQNAPSPETLEMYGALEASLRGTVTTAIASNRKHSAAEVNAWLKRSIFTSQEALKAGLVDRVGYLPAWQEELKAEAKAQRYVELRPYLQGSGHLDEPRISKGPEAIALIEARGEIVSETRNNSEQIAPDYMIEQLQWAAEEEDVKAVVMRVDSPGGSALASDLIWDEVRKLAEKKPLVVSMGAVAASGGYYISAPATMIVAEPTTITGSIGVIGGIPKGVNIAEKWGVNFYMVTASDRKDYLNFATKSSEEDKELIRNSIKETYDAFVQKVAAGRKQTPERIYQIAEGRVYTGADAVTMGLVDRLGGFAEAVRAAKELAKLDPEKLYSLVEYQPQPENLLDCIRSGNFGECLGSIGASRSLLQWKSHMKMPLGLDQLERATDLLQSGEPLAYWPGALRWNARPGLVSPTED
ncbi:signal peptide peptidase SppA [Oligoflexus tunisiensis]|uniref:signal peptide peptidase SppA n=1 Tax=Oligoflexus tunisiensis TaxID=708132 RepID=UPI00114CCC2B|nr:signal peptide peptidase SppA [Oligoflexus tunisiensis]